MNISATKRGGYTQCFMTDCKKDMEAEARLLTKAASIEEEYQVNDDSKSWTIAIN